MIESINVPINVYIDNLSIDRTYNIKYLGVMFDDCLSFKDNGKYVMNKLSKKVYLLNRISKCLSMFTKILLYRSIVAPHLQYCSTILFGLPQVDIQRMQKIQNRAMRSIFGCNRYTPIVTMLDVLNFMSVRQEIVYRTMEFIQKVKLNLLPNYLSDNLKYVYDVHTYMTRNRGNFYIQSCSTYKTYNTVFYKGLSMYNELPLEIKDCTSVETFRILCTKHIRNNV